ncbi:MAG: signal peptidase II [Spirochaetales bacterium]|nr:signal peptidase II [Spirochaetales bacterium]
MANKLREKLFPYLITLLVVIFDQVTKTAVSADLHIHETGFTLFNGFIRIVHEKNLGVAFSLGAHFPAALRYLLFVVFPLFVLGYVVFYSFKADNFSRFQRFVIAGITGGGLGNIIDRIFRPDGVIDFISLKMYGLFHISHFPTFNIADFALASCTLMLLLSLLFGIYRIKKERTRKIVNGYNN